MSLSIVVLTNDEKFLRFLDPDLCELGDDIEKGGLRTLDFKYTFQDLKEDKKLFQQGNKIWVQGDVNLTDCLYVINTNVENSIYNDNYFHTELEEALVELNYTPLFHQNELTTANGFNIRDDTTGIEVTINYNALNYWFGSWFNIGVVQDCISNTAQKMTLKGSMTRMSLLRQIEEESGNYFVTRYEKDVKTNTIHKYIDFLNPINCNKNWEMNIDVDFIATEMSGCYDSNDNPVSEGLPDAEDEDDIVELPDVSPYSNLDPEHTKYRLVDKDYNLITSNGTPLEWTSQEIGLDTATGSVALQLTSIKGDLGLETKTKSFIVQTDPYVTDALSPGFIDVAHDPDVTYNCVLPDDSYFEMVDTETEKVIYRTQINTQIGTVHPEVLQFGQNLENVVFEVDETDTYSAVSPILGDESSANDLTRGNMESIINSWLNLSVTKGEIVPMILEKVNVTATSLSAARTAMGTFNKSSNYWVRPLKPQDNTDSNDKTYEFLKATGYWRAPYSKRAGEFHVTTDKETISNYKYIYDRPDGKDKRHPSYEKMGTVSTSDEDKYAIFNQVCMYLQQHETPDIHISVDVANIQGGGQFNNYDLHDKVYIKVPVCDELITACVNRVSKEAHNVAKNSIELDNYSINTVKTLQNTTYIEVNNTSFKYPKSGKLTARFVNADYDPEDEYSIEYPANKLLTFSIYSIENSNEEFTGKVFTRITDVNGRATIPLKLEPGLYSVDVYFPGDEEFTESLMTAQVSVGGTLTVPEKQEKTNTSKSNPVKKTPKTKTKTVKTYWTKCGLSPDKKHKKIISVAKPSSADANDYAYRLYRTVFKNYCPNCKKWGTLRFDGGKSNKCITSAGAHGRGYKINVPEHEITCIHCDSDYCGVTGLEKSHSHISRLKTVSKPVKVGSSEFSKLVKGKLQYGTKTVKIKEKKVTSNKQRSTSSGIPKDVKNWALNIVGDSKGWPAAKKLAKESGKWKYVSYSNWSRKPSTVIKSGGNCCDQARALAVAMDAAGCLEYLTIKYVYVCCNPRNSIGHVFLKVIHKKTGKWVYVDPTYTRNPWGHHISGWGSPPGTQYTYHYGSTPW